MYFAGFPCVSDRYTANLLAALSVCAFPVIPRTAIVRVTMVARVLDILYIEVRHKVTNLLPFYQDRCRQ